MADLEDAKAGDLILVPLNTGGWSPKTFFLPVKVTRTTKTQVIVENNRGKEVKYKRDSGYEIGQSTDYWARTRVAKPYSITEDQTDAAAIWQARQELEYTTSNLYSEVKISELSNIQLESLFNLLTSFKEEQDK